MYNFVSRIYNYLKKNLAVLIKRQNVLTKFNCNHKPFSAILCNDIIACFYTNRKLKILWTPGNEKPSKIEWKRKRLEVVVIVFCKLRNQLREDLMAVSPNFLELQSCYFPVIVFCLYRALYLGFSQSSLWFMLVFLSLISIFWGNGLAL